MDFFPNAGREPQYGLSNSPSFSVDTVQFGDGYAQRRPSGLNSTRREWDLEWTALTHDQMETIYNFLMSRLGVYAFWWSLPCEPENVKVVCKEPPQKTYSTYRLYTLTATFTEDFGA